jgi:23S rRNA (adenine2503-C2)-methyltransferase
MLSLPLRTTSPTDPAPAPLALAGLTLPELRQWVVDRGLPAYRAAQIHTALYRRLVTSVDELTDVPRDLRLTLGRDVRLSQLQAVNEVHDRPSQTTKTLFALADGALVESVQMGYTGRDGHRRFTVCLSSQVGCALGCTFCATGLQGWARDLTAGEMVEQVLFYARRLRATGQHVTNVVYMGMGEPLLNYDAVLQSLRVLTEPAGFNLGARHLTVSTSGVVPGILRFAGEGTQAGLAVSLHAPNDALRSRLVPLNRRYGLAEVLAACRTYVAKTRRRISFEYTMLEGVNDGPEQAQELAAVLHGLLCHVNLIPWNRVEGLPFRPSSPETILAFQAHLQRAGLPVTVRDTRGSQITAACGQLRTITVRPRRAALPSTP